MNKENILYGIIGLLLGVIVGYFVTDSINKTGQTNPPAASAAAGQELAPAPQAPAAAADSGAGPQAEVMAAIGKARQEPTNFTAQLAAAKLFYQIQSFDKGAEFIERATANASRATDKDFATLRELGDAVFFAKRFADAEKWYRLALRLKADDADLQSDLGACYFNLQPRQLDQAIAAWRAALKYDPRQETALQNLTAALLEKGERAAAAATMQQLEKAYPGNQALGTLRQRINAP
ncbi:MAG: hypothetical protein ACKV2V_09925 [Blastocatellia bacterium]